MNSLEEMQARNGASDGEKKFYEQVKDVAKVIQSHAQEGRGQAVHSDRMDSHSLSMQRQLREVKLHLDLWLSSPQANTHTHTHTDTHTHTHITGECSTFRPVVVKSKESYFSKDNAYSNKCTAACQCRFPLMC